ncbi:pyridoxal phosphate-dependent aminotransferase [Sediminibacterium sp.]|uniref:pyridoxal phosphate-dependent aminotransferase n=1 Tax=Sediminibacterium sp. TaxID=1917865 RepID=UPI003F69CCF8
MSKLSHLAETLIGSEIVKLGNAINERIRNGETIYNFTIGDFNPGEFPIPVELEQLIIEAYQQKKTSYPAAEGILDLRKSISQFIQDWEGLHFTPAEIQVASGGRPLIYALFKVIVDKGDKVVYGVPSWNNNHYVHLTEGQHCEVNCLPENDFMPTVEDLKPHIKGAGLICLCTPQNPTGTTLGKNALAEICELILEENASRGPEEKKLYLMFDQMYWTLTYGDTVHYNPLTLNPAMKPYTIFIDGISKVFSATGVRVGWALGPENVITKMKAILSHLGAWAPMAEQHAVAKYLPMKEAIGTYLTHFKSEIAFRLQSIYEGIIALKQKGFKVDAIAPQAAIYLTIQIDLVGSKTAEGTLLATQSDVTQYILSEAKIAIVPFSAFGAGANSSWYRLSVGTCRKQDIPTVLAQLGAALEKLS